MGGVSWRRPVSEGASHHAGASNFHSQTFNLVFMEFEHMQHPFLQASAQRGRQPVGDLVVHNLLDTSTYSSDGGASGGNSMSDKRQAK